MTFGKLITWDDDYTVSIFLKIIWNIESTASFYK